MNHESNRVVPSIVGQYAYKNYLERQEIETSYFKDKFRTITKSSGLALVDVPNRAEKSELGFTDRQDSRSLSPIGKEFTDNQRYEIRQAKKKAM